MNELPELPKLSESDKDELIRTLWAQVLGLRDQVKELQGRLAKNSQNSSKPPSSDGLNKPKPKSLRQAGQNPSGGQKGHSGNTLERVAHADHVVTHEPAAQCDVCGGIVGDLKVDETRQVFDLPQLKSEVTEHRRMQGRCGCGKVHRGEFPKEVSGPVQYGAQALAAVVHLTQHHMMPVRRTGQLMGDFFGLAMSDGTVIEANRRAEELLKPSVELIGQALQKAPVAHADETGIRVAKKLHWLHVLATPSLTWIGRHAKRGKEAFDALGLLAGFGGTLIHDGWKSYQDLACKHGLCNAHHLRELTYVHEELGQSWAKRMSDLLVGACHEVNSAGQPLPPERVSDLRRAYDEILTDGQAVNPPAAPSGKRGRTKQSKPFNLLSRLREHAHDVWRFASDAGVPFSNNVAEQAFRMAKVKQKVSGCFRTAKGADSFCTIRSYTSTMHKQGANIFRCLALAFQGKTPQPRLS